MTPEMKLAQMLSHRPLEKKASAPVDQKAIEKLAWAENVGRTLAKEKVANLPTPGVVGGALHSLGGLAARGAATKAGTRMAVGAGVGAAGGAMMDPGVDPATGQRNSRIGNMAMGAAGGAAAGKMLPRGVSALGAHSGNFAQGVRSAATAPGAAAGVGNVAKRMEGAIAQKATGAVAPAAAAAVPGAAPAARPAPSPEVKARFDKLHADMQGRRAGEQALAAGGLAPQEIAARQAHGKGMPQVQAGDPNMDAFRQHAAVLQANAQNSTVGGRAQRAVGRVTGSDRGVMAGPGGAKIVTNSVNPDRVDMGALLNLMQERLGR